MQRVWVRATPVKLAMGQLALLLLASFTIFTSVFAADVVRFYNRSLFVYDPNPSAVTKYTISFGYHTITNVGSLDILFCNDPIPTDPCDAPPGLDVSHAVLSDQTGGNDYTILSRTANHIVLTRNPDVVTTDPSSYTFDNVVNPNSTAHSFAARLSDYASTNAAGPIIDLGSITSQATAGVALETQVPPILVFCVAHIVDPNCNGTSGGNYTDMGQLSEDETLMATSQMAAGTNASLGYAITVHGLSMTAGSHEIDALTSPTPSAMGNNQFGINLVANTEPDMGHDKDGGDSAITVVAPNYDIPNSFTYNDGDVVAEAPHVSLVERYTVSYIVNAAPSLRPGVYTTTITYLCTGRF